MLQMIDITFATKGNAADFGNLTLRRRGTGGVVQMIQEDYLQWRRTSLLNTYRLLTIATIGNATDFGDLSVMEI